MSTEEELKALRRLEQQVKLAIDMVERGPVFHDNSNFEKEDGDYDFRVGDFMILDKLKREQDYPIRCTHHKTQ